MEAVLLSTTLPYLKVKEEGGSRSAKNFIKLKQNIDRPLAAILSLNTIAHTIGAAGVGAQATKVFGELYFGIISAVLTLLILVLSEIIPKTIGASYWRELVVFTGHAIKVTIFITYPLVVLFPYITKLFSKKGDKQTISREEISVLANIGTKEGIFVEKENIIIQNIIRLKSIRVAEIMTPRVVVSVADEKMTLEEFLKNSEFLHFSRIPVFSKKAENITGYVFRQTVFEKLAENEVGMTLENIKRNIVVIPESNPLFKVWETLLGKKEHIALIVDEYGGMDGIVTMEDIIETLLGIEIVDETDTITDMQQHARERWNRRKLKYNLLDQFKHEKE
jgi:CBS domain containing-hemolysin-like protein